jgi:hypothetical protein
MGFRLKSSQAGHVLCYLRSDADPSPIAPKRGSPIAISEANEQLYQQRNVIYAHGVYRRIPRGIGLIGMACGPLLDTAMHMRRQSKSVLCNRTSTCAQSGFPDGLKQM